MTDATRNDAAATPVPARKTRLSQEDVPGYSLEQALKVAEAIAENYAYNPTRPLNVAQAMGVTPTSGGFRGVTGAAVAYGLTTGAYNSAEIGLTPIGLRIVRPTTEGDDTAARREALLKPRVIGDFLRQYDGAALPTDLIARNVLAEKGVPNDRTEQVLQLILDSAKNVGFIREWSGKRFVDLSGAGAAADDSADADSSAPASPGSAAPASPATPPAPLSPPLAAPSVSLSSGVNINIEIHIAADASSQVVEDIFKNMRRYVLKPDSESDVE